MRFWENFEVSKDEVSPSGFLRDSAKGTPVSDMALKVEAKLAREVYAKKCAKKVHPSWENSIVQKPRKRTECMYSSEELNPENHSLPSIWHHI